MMQTLREYARPVPEGHVPLPTYRLSDPRDVARLRRLRCQAGCILSLGEGLYACITHGVTLGWTRP